MAGKMSNKDANFIDSLVNAPQSGKILSQNMGRPIENDCFNGDGPPCQDLCPVNLDIIAFINKVQKGNFNSAYTIFREHALFPEIVCALCPAPCTGACVRKDIDQSLDMKKLERAVVDFARPAAPYRYAVPKQGRRAAVVGAGLCGLSCTIRLAGRGYDVTLFEKTGRLGGRLWDMLPPDVFPADIESQMLSIQYERQLNTEIKSPDELKGFDAVLIAAGAGERAGPGGGSFKGLLEGWDESSPGCALDGFFLAGRRAKAPSRATGVGVDAADATRANASGATDAADAIMAIELGKRAAQAMDNYLKTNNMHDMTGICSRPGSRFTLDLCRVEKAGSVAAPRYTEEDAKEEAARCLKCDCRNCLDHCDFMSFYKKLPKKIVGEVRTTLSPVQGLQKRIATRLIASCSACGLCGEVCPAGIDTGGLLIESRRIMHREGALPPAWHDFWLRDMEFANGDSCCLSKNAPGFENSGYAFFPGCQIGASDPDYVKKAYSYLRSVKADTALLLMCCGAPAEWAGDEPGMEENIKSIGKEWEKMGKPKFIFACPSCEKMFRSYLPGIEQVSLYALIEEAGLPEGFLRGGGALSVYDPCSSRYDRAMQDSVRGLVEAAGYKAHELPFGKGRARCCGYGGHIYPANEALAEGMAASRAQMSEYPYVTYCANCRDIFSSQGKPARHILDIVFGLNEENRKAPSMTERRNNRVALKQALLKEVWPGEIIAGMEDETRLIIPPELAEKLSKSLILEEDVQSVIEYCEKTGNYIIEEGAGNRIGHLRRGIITYWVSYRPAAGSYEVANAYSHRMSIEGE